MKKKFCSAGAVVKIDGGLRAHLISVDPCGENGEFHRFVFAGPISDGDIDVSLGEVVECGGFVFANLLSSVVEGKKNVA